MGKRLFNRNPAVTTYWHGDQPGQVTIEKVFDREPVLNRAARRRLEKQTGELRHVASIPTPLFYQWIMEGKLSDTDYQIVDGDVVMDPRVDMKKLQRLLNDPEYKNLRCTDKPL